MDFINANENTELLKMDMKDLNILLNLLNEYNLELRDNLNLNKNITFGIEIESEFADITNIENEIELDGLKNTWQLKDDYTLDNGIEISSPILKDDSRAYKEIELVCNIFKKYSKIGVHSGGHIHIGSQILESEHNILALVNFWSLFEHVIYRFTNGEYLNIRPSADLYATPLRCLSLPSPYNFSKYNNVMVDSCIRLCNISSFKNKKIRNTIEFRSPNGTFEPVIWQNNLNLFTKMIEKVKTIDVEKLYYDYFSNFSISVNEYNKIYFEDAIRFADLIFDKNIDKMYFLRQYLKNNDVSNRYVKTKRFVK